MLCGNIGNIEGQLLIDANYWFDPQWKMHAKMCLYYF